MERKDVIKKQTKPTAWFNSMVTVVKPNGKLRICMDPKDLNRAIRREHYPMKTVYRGWLTPNTSPNWTTVEDSGNVNWTNHHRSCAR